MQEKNVIAIFGGAFNPPLNSHFSLAEQIINEYSFINKIIFVPVNSKYNKEDLLSNEHRYNMLKLVCDNNENFLVSDIETNNDKPLYTIEALTKMQEIYPNKIIWFVIGTDNLKQLSTWKKADELVKKFKILILERNNDKMEDIIDKNTFLKENEDAFIKVNSNVRSYLSSTFVREKIKSEKSIRYLVPDEVYYYIKVNNLFERN